MVYPDNMIASDDITVIAQYTEIYNASGTEITAIEQSFYHIPFFFWVVIFSVVSIFLTRAITEVVIRFRNKK